VPHPNPEEFFQQADLLAANPAASDADLRRAISAAYYGLFHFTLTAAADMVAAEPNRGTERYMLIYRSVDHSRLRSLCSEIRKTNPQKLSLMPQGGFGTIAEFARIALNLQELRIFADYDPSKSFTTTDASLAPHEAREAIKWFQQGTPEQRESFLILLLGLKGRR
jgi:hypothetical protein